MHLYNAIQFSYRYKVSMSVQVCMCRIKFPKEESYTLKIKIDAG